MQSTSSRVVCREGGRRAAPHDDGHWPGELQAPVPRVQVCTISAPVLDNARLATVFESLAASTAGVICLQETRHRELGPRWALRLAQQFG
eukprot:4600014-Pyramimonas_sp.AAC.1